MHGKLFFKLKQRLKAYRLGMLASDVKNFVTNEPREINKLERRIVSLKPRNPSRGNVLLCYPLNAFVLKPGDAVPNSHTHFWESLQIAETFLDLGYQVDVIDENNDTYIPAKHYSFFVGNRINFDRIVESINPDCVKILHIDTAHWLLNNLAEYERLQRLQERKGAALPPRRYLIANSAIEQADCATVLGNDFTIGTYSYANKPIYRVPISTSMLYDWPEDKNFEATRKHFLWFGSGGFVHKGLDLVLDAFARLPDHHLTVCGPIDEESDFKSLYYKELFEMPNIRTVGWTDVSSAEFLEIASSCIAVIHPSCAEGGGGSVITCMHAGLLPIVSRETSVDVDERFGLVLNESSVEAIRASIQSISDLPAQQLKQMSRISWESARENHTREQFAAAYARTISHIMNADVGRRQAVDRRVVTRAVSTQLKYPDSSPRIP